MNRQVRTSKTGGRVSTARRATRSKRWTFAADAHGYGLGAGVKISSKRMGKGVSRAVAPSSTSTTVSQYKPRVSGGTSANSFTIENRELLSSVNWQGTPGFELVEYSINPGLSTTFQYASNVSKNYTRYAMNMCLMWAPSVPSTTLGQIAFAMDRDNTAPAPSSMQEILSYENNIVTSLWKNVSFPQTGMFASSEKLLYLRYGPLDDFSQINLYDLMKVFVVLNGVASNDLSTGNSLGSLYIQYKITFFNQKLQDVVESNVFSVNPLYDASLVTPGLYPNITTDEQETDFKYVYGDGDIQYQEDIVSPGQGWIIFPSAGYYSVDLYECYASTSGLPTGTIVAPIIDVQSVGNSIVWSASALEPESEDILVTTVSAYNTGHYKYIVRVTESGSYATIDGPVGEGYIVVESGGAYTAITTSPNIGTLTGVEITNCYVVVNRISAAQAAYYDAVTFPEGAVPGPQAHIQHRRKFYPVRGHARRRHQVQKTKPTKSSAPEIVEHDEPEQAEPPSELSTYEEYMMWKKKQLK